MQTVEINSFSTKLQELVEKARPKSGITTFRLLAAPTPVEAADSTNRRFTIDRMPARTRMLRKESITDPGTNRRVSIANLTGYEEGAALGQAQRPIIEEVVFLGANNGQIDVPHTNYELFVRLLLSNYNKDNPNPSAVEPETGYLFGIVKPEKDASAKLTNKMAIVRAMSAIDQLGDAAVLRAVEKLSLPTMDRGRKLEVDELKMSLVMVAETAPERVEAVLDSGESKLEELIKKAVDAGIIDFVGEAQQWRYKATQEPITEAVQGYKPEEALVMYIQKNANGPKFSQTLAARVAQAEKGKK